MSTIKDKAELWAMLAFSAGYRIASENAYSADTLDVFWPVTESELDQAWEVYCVTQKQADEVATDFFDFVELEWLRDVLQKWVVELNRTTPSTKG